MEPVVQGTRRDVAQDGAQPGREDRHHLTWALIELLCRFH
jgi:hypothetical protein